MKKVNVLIPTYNGENYLRYQLDSIIDQNYKNIDVYIRDDGSTDNTLEIIKEYCEKKIMGIRFFYIESNGENLGYPDCFWKMIELYQVQITMLFVIKMTGGHLIRLNRLSSY